MDTTKIGVGSPDPTACPYPGDRGQATGEEPFPFCSGCNRPLVKCGECGIYNRRWADYCRKCRTRLADPVVDVDGRMRLPASRLFTGAARGWSHAEPIKYGQEMPAVPYKGVLAYPVNGGYTTVVRNAVWGAELTRFDTRRPWSTFAATDEQGLILGLGHELWRLDRDTYELAEAPAWSLDDPSKRIFGTPVIVGAEGCAYVVAERGAGMNQFLRLEPGGGEQLLGEIPEDESSSLLGPVRLRCKIKNEWKEWVIVFSKQQTWQLELGSGRKPDEVPNLDPDFAPTETRARWAPYREWVVLSAGGKTLYRYRPGNRSLERLSGSEEFADARIGKLRDRLVLCGRGGIATATIDRRVAISRPHVEGEFRDPPCVVGDRIFAVDETGARVFVVTCDQEGDLHGDCKHREDDWAPFGEPVYCDDTLIVTYRSANQIELRASGLSGKKG